MKSDGFWESFKSMVRRVRDEEDRVDYLGLYPARVVSQSGQEVDVVFDDARLLTKSGVPLAPTVAGRRLTLAPGTRVLVGWQAGDERAPYVAGVWLGDGGLVRVEDVFSDVWKFSGPEVWATQDLRAGHLLSGDALQVGAEGTTAPGTAVLGAAAGTSQGEAVVSLQGGDLMSTVRVLSGTPPPVLPPGIVYSVWYTRAYDSAPQLFLWNKSGATGADVASYADHYDLTVSSPLTAATQYEFRVLGVGA